MSAKRFKELRRNKFYLFWCRFFVDLNALNAVVQLFYLQRGLSLSQIFYLGVVWSATTLIFEIPTSFLADSWGRKRLILIGVILNIVANGVYFVAQDFWVFALQAALMSLSFSCFSGVEDAFLYDTLKEMGQEDVILKTSGKYMVASRLAKIFTPFLGALLVKDLLPAQFNLLLAVNFCTSFVAIFFALSLKEPKITLSASAQKVGVLALGLKALRYDVVFCRMALNKTFIFIGSFIFWKLYQGYFQDLGVTVFWLGLFYPIFNAVYIAVFMSAEKIFKEIPAGLIFGAPVAILLIGSLILLLTKNIFIVYLVAVLIISVGTIRDPFFTQQVQWRLPSKGRATGTSIFYYLKSVLDIPLLFLSGYLAFYGTNFIFLLLVFLGLLTLLLFPIKKEDLVLSYNNS